MFFYISDLNLLFVLIYIVFVLVICTLQELLKSSSRIQGPQLGVVACKLWPNPGFDED
jgi:hypothetical protein